MKIRIGVGLGTGHALQEPTQLGEVVDLLEDLAFDSLWMSERVVGRGLDPIAALAYAAARTTNLKLGTNVLILAGKDPRLAAKQLATVDELSGGRLLPAVGLGKPHPSDQPPYAVERGTRGQVFEAAFASMREHWERLGTRPLEVWFGSRSAAALERTGRLADGWLGSFQTPAETAAARLTIVAAAAAAGRTIDDDHYGTVISYTRGSRTDEAVGVVQSLSEHTDVEQLLPAGGAELATVIAAHVNGGLTKFVLIPANQPSDWAEEFTWLREVTAPLET